MSSTSKHERQREKLVGEFHTSIQQSLDDLVGCQEIKTIRAMECGKPKAIDPRSLGHNAGMYQEGFLTVYSYTREASQRILIEVESDYVERVKEKISEVNDKYFGEQIKQEMQRYKHYFSEKS